MVGQSESVVPYLYDSAFLPSVLLWASREGKGREGATASRADMAEKTSREGGPPSYCMVGLHPTGNWQLEGLNSPTWGQNHGGDRTKQEQTGKREEKRRELH